MGSLSIGYSTRALFWDHQAAVERRVVGGRREGRFEVHILLCLFTNEQVHILHMGVECGVSLSFLVPDKPSSGNNNMAARDI